MGGTMWTIPPDAERLPLGEGPEELWHRSRPLAGSDAEAYFAKRRVPLGVAGAADVRFTEDLEGRPAVLARLAGPSGDLRAVHGRYLHNRQGEGKMLTVGRRGDWNGAARRAGAEDLERWIRRGRLDAPADSALLHHDYLRQAVRGKDDK
jgi:hypothetical protein